MPVRRLPPRTHLAPPSGGGRLPTVRTQGASRLGGGIWFRLAVLARTTLDEFHQRRDALGPAQRRQAPQEGPVRLGLEPAARQLGDAVKGYQAHE